MTSPMPVAQTPTSRRAFFSGAATVGVTAAVVTTLPQLTVDSVDAKVVPPAPENGGGYCLSEHVKRYYQTATV
jgi:hypothetical protein